MTEEKKDKSRAEVDKELDQALKDSFPGSDPVQLTDPNRGLGGAPKKPRPDSQPE
nr:hypothetical protein [uncultured Roseococcus sp.]